jgi:hypothetical protein
MIRASQFLRLLAGQGSHGLSNKRSAGRQRARFRRLPDLLGAVETTTNTTAKWRFRLSNVKTGLGDHERLLVSPRRACYLLDCGTTHLYELIDNDEIESFLDGRSRKIVVASIHRLIAKRLASKQASKDVPQRRPREASAAGIVAEGSTSKQASNAGPFLSAQSAAGLITNERASTQASKAVPRRRRAGPCKEATDRLP